MNRLIFVAFIACLGVAIVYFLFNALGTQRTVDAVVRGFDDVRDQRRAAAWSGNPLPNGPWELSGIRFAVVSETDADGNPETLIRADLGMKDAEQARKIAYLVASKLGGSQIAIANGGAGGGDDAIGRVDVKEAAWVRQDVWLKRDGRQPMTGVLRMDGNSITGVDWICNRDATPKCSRWPPFAAADPDDPDSDCRPHAWWSPPLGHFSPSTLVVQENGCAMRVELGTQEMGWGTNTSEEPEECSQGTLVEAFVYERGDMRSRPACLQTDTGAVIY